MGEANPLRCSVQFAGNAWLQVENEDDAVRRKLSKVVVAREGVDSSQCREHLTEMVAKRSAHSDDLTGTIGPELSAGGGSMDGQYTYTIVEFMRLSSPRSTREFDLI